LSNKKGKKKDASLGIGYKKCLKVNEKSPFSSEKPKLKVWGHSLR
jgi:hypothetical protein